MWTKAISFLVAISALQAQPAPTRMGEHKMGESLQEWLTITHALDGLEAICASRKRADRDKCKELSDLRDGKMKFLKTGDPGGRTMTWEFANGRLATIHVDPGFDINAHIQGTIQEEVLFLTRTYGEPTKIGTVPYQNSYGAKWDCLEADWDMPDGTHIKAWEFIASGQTRLYSVMFLSKEYIEDEDRKRQSKPNPYDR